MAVPGVRDRRGGPADHRRDRPDRAVADRGRRVAGVPRARRSRRERAGVPRRASPSCRRAADASRPGRRSRTSLRRSSRTRCTGATGRRGREPARRGDPAALRPGERGSERTRARRRLGRYGAIDALHGVDLRSRAASCSSCSARRGAASRTVLRVVAGLEPVTGGRVHIAGRDVTPVAPAGATSRWSSRVVRALPAPDRRGRTSPSAWRCATCPGGGPAPGRRRRPRSAARRCSTGGPASSPAASGSGSRSPGRWSASRTCFLLDEPLSNLDPELRVRDAGRAAGPAQRLGATMVHVTHDQTEALVLADRIAVLRDGRIEQVGPPTRSGAGPRPASSPASSAPRDEPAPGGRAVAPRRARRRGWRRLELGFRPEHLGARGDGGGRGRPRRGGREDAYVHLAGGGARVVARVAAARPRPGDGSVVVRRPEHVHVFDAETGRRYADGGARDRRSWR